MFKVRYPKTKMEFILTIILGIASLILLLYMILNLYKCMCSRNYPQWRSSWIHNKRPRRPVYYTAFRESLPIVLNGHQQVNLTLDLIYCRIVSSLSAEGLLKHLGSHLHCFVRVSSSCRRRIVSLYSTRVVSFIDIAIWRYGKNPRSSGSPISRSGSAHLYK